MGKCLFAFITGFCLTLPTLANADAFYPAFTAQYLVKTNGLKTAIAEFTLTLDAQGNYVYRQQSSAVGLASLFTSAKSEQTSRGRFIDGAIVVSEFNSERKGGDDDDNARLVFNWETSRVNNIGAGEHWDIEMPAGTLDIMVMQLAMTLDLIRGEKVFEYPVAVRGRIKHFQFEQVAEEPVTVGTGTYNAIKVQRMDDDKDQSWTWSVPELDYFPVRFVKKKKGGLTVDILLEKLAFETAPTAAANDASPESAPVPAAVAAPVASQTRD